MKGLTFLHMLVLCDADFSSYNRIFRAKESFPSLMEKWRSSYLGEFVVLAGITEGHQVNFTVASNIEYASWKLIPGK